MIDFFYYLVPVGIVFLYLTYSFVSIHYRFDKLEKLLKERDKP